MATKEEEEDHHRIMVAVDNAIDVIGTNLVSRKRLALFRIELLVELLHHDSDDNKNNGNDDVDHVLQGKLGLPSMFVATLQYTVEDFLAMLRRIPQTTQSTTRVLLSKTTEFQRLTKVLSTYQRLAVFDPTIEEEVGYEGAHQYLSKLLKIDPTSVPSAAVVYSQEDNNAGRPQDEEVDTDDNDDDEDDPNHDAIMEIHDRVCEVVAVCSPGSFPRMKTPLTKQELKARLPLVFDIRASCDAAAVPNNNSEKNGTENDDKNDEKEPHNSRKETILIHQVTSRQTAQKDVGYLMWPAAVILSRYIVSNPDILMMKKKMTVDERTSASSSPKKILELGAGCGLVGLVAASLISKRIKDNNLGQESHTASTDESQDGIIQEGDKSHCVILSDFNDVVVENLHRNILLNGLEDVTTSEGLDFYEQDPQKSQRRGVSDGNEGTSKGWVTPDGRIMDKVDLILASDIICQPEDAYAAARTIDCGLKSTGKALVVLGGSKHRFGVDKFEDACLEQNLIISKIDDRKFINDKNRPTTDDGESYTDDCDDDMEKCQGFTDVMTYSFWVVEKRCDNQ